MTWQFIATEIATQIDKQGLCQLFIYFLASRSPVSRWKFVGIFGLSRSKDFTWGALPRLHWCLHPADCCAACYLSWFDVSLYLVLPTFILDFIRCQCKSWSHWFPSSILLILPFLLQSWQPVERNSHSRISLLCFVESVPRIGIFVPDRPNLDKSLNQQYRTLGFTSSGAGGAGLFFCNSVFVSSHLLEPG